MLEGAKYPRSSRVSCLNISQILWKYMINRSLDTKNYQYDSIFLPISPNFLFTYGWEFSFFLFQLARVLEAKDEGELLIRRLERELDVIRKSSLSAKKISGPNDVKKLHKSNADRSNHVRLLKSSSEKYLSNSNTESESFNKQPEMGEVRGRHIEAGEAGFLDESIFQKVSIQYFHQLCHHCHLKRITWKLSKLISNSCEGGGRRIFIKIHV